ncbi:HD-GYP domain-containing protein [Cohnella sp. LGH]|uniref:HD-GYP domain-containing protein n=1 Tax=Cohnella TaxID=329857 RepID=UPI000E23F085|nr:MULTISPECIES: HD-GYP domain-containing protein [Cohnella]QTH41225.1 HD-GYP domain-containing protein [Cohnella sp. LGH]
MRAVGDFPHHFDHTSDISEMMKLLRHKHEDTYHHCVRVALLSEKVASAMGMDSASAQKLLRGCFIHDLGKLLVPTAILDSVNPLTEEQWALIRRHPEYGTDILKDRGERDADLVRLVLHHHERWDGKGYPCGLAGEQIPLFARICSVVDAFDTMMSPRPYRRRKRLEEAMEELRRNAGTQFDAAVVNAFIPLGAEVAPLYFSNYDNED